MKNENKVKKLVLRKETLRDLTAMNAGAVKGGSPTNGKRCSNGGKATACGYGCPTYAVDCTVTCYTCGWQCMTYSPCH